MKNFEIEFMTRTEVETFLAENPVMILPVGSTEQHGFHLPLGTDTILAKALAKKVAQRTNSLIIPALYYGYSWVWHKIPGTITLEQEHFKIVLKDIIKSVERYGTKLLIIINGHDANNQSLKYTVREMKYQTDMKILYFFYPKFSEIYKKYCESEIQNGLFHAEEFETSLMLAENDRLVDMTKAVKEYPEYPPLYSYTSEVLGDISKSGVFGDATAAGREKGEKMFEEFADEICKAVNLLKNNKL